MEKERKQIMSKWSEVKSDYTDDNGVMHIDAFVTEDGDENGKTIALIVNGEVYYKDYDATTDPLAKEVIECGKVENKKDWAEVWKPAE